MFSSMHSHAFALAPVRRLRVLNRTGRYRYLSYEFRNRSVEIRELFAGTCAMVGVEYTRSSDRIRICRRASVTEMAAFVGTKR
jgi:hypothetical protein